MQVKHGPLVKRKTGFHVGELKFILDRLLPRQKKKDNF